MSFNDRPPNSWEEEKALIIEMTSHNSSNPYLRKPDNIIEAQETVTSLLPKYYRPSINVGVE